MHQQRSNNKYSPNWFDRHHVGFVNLVLYALMPHSKAERDELVLGGQLRVEDMNALWPRPWLYMRTLLLFVVELVLLFICWKLEQRYESSFLLPGLTVVGSLTVPVTLLIFFWEINKWRSLTLLDVLRYFLIGSCFAITITFVLQYVLDFIPDYRVFYNKRGNYFTPRLLIDYGLTPMVITACVEEFAKAIAIYSILFHYRRQCHILHGVLIGAAVGAGFAVFESAGYIAMDIDNLMFGIIIRSLTAPACHVAWGALMGGAAALATRGKFHLRTMLHPLVLFAFLLTCALHFAWNYLLDTSLTINRSIELSIITWFLLLLMIWQGVREIERKQTVPF